MAVGFAALLATTPAAVASPARTTTAPVVVLPTGESIQQNGRVHSVTPAGAGRSLISLTLGGKAYVLPAAAVPHLGRGLDLSLFDVQALRKAESNGRIPVDVSYRGSSAPALPGVTMTGSHTGYLTGASAKVFGSALAARFATDRGKSSGLFDDATRMSLTGAPTGRRAQPRFPMKTLTFTGTDAAGAPDEGSPVVVFNLDDSDRFGSGPEAVSWFYRGQAKFSVPTGRYAALSLFFSLTPAGEVTGVRVVTRQEFDVAADQTIPLAATEASSKVTMVTPRPAEPQEGGFALHRTGLAGPSLYVDVSVPAGAPIWVAPTTSAVRTGTLDSYPYRRLTSPQSAKTRYEYALQYPASGRIPRQVYVAGPHNLAVIDASYYAEMDTVGVRQRGGIYKFEWDSLIFRGSHPMAFPVRQEEYVSTEGAPIWFGGMAKYTRDIGGFQAWYGGQYYDSVQYQAGKRYSEGWNAFPLHPAGETKVASDPDLVTVPPAVRSGDTDRINFQAFTDQQPGHHGMGIYGDRDDTVAGSYLVEQDGKTIAEGSAEYGIPDVELSPQPSTVRVVFDALREGPKYRLSTRSRTEWTWRTEHQTRTLPAGFTCPVSRGEPPSRNCAAEPLLLVNTAIRDLSLRGTVRPGSQAVDLTVSHVQTAAASKVTGAKLEFSTDDGKTWKTAGVRPLGGGKFRAMYGIAKPGLVTLRVTATDLAGGRVVETLTRAYEVV